MNWALGLRGQCAEVLDSDPCLLYVQSKEMVRVFVLTVLLKYR